MTKVGIFAELRDFLELLSRSGLAIYVNPVIYERNALSGQAVESITTSRFAERIYVREENYFYSVANLLDIVERGDYAAILYDGAILQFRFDFLANGLVGHRLCYMPLPWEIDTSLLQLGNLHEVLLCYLKDNALTVRLRTPMRFDYNAYAEGEPAAHLHLVHDSGRLPLSRPLGIGDFVKFVFFTFYKNDWNRFSFLNELSSAETEQCISEDDQAGLHLYLRNRLLSRALI